MMTIRRPYSLGSPVDAAAPFSVPHSSDIRVRLLSDAASMNCSTASDGVFAASTCVTVEAAQPSVAPTMAS